MPPMSVVSLAVLRPEATDSSEMLQAMLERQREAFLKDGPPSLAARRADLASSRRRSATMPSASPR